MTDIASPVMFDARPRKIVACAHCGLTVPRSRTTQHPAFCCDGCSAAYHIIESAGLGSYYGFREQNDVTMRPVTPTAHSYAELDEPTFAELYATVVAEDLVQVELYVEGVHCAACVWLLERLPRLVQGVAEARLEFGSSMLRVVRDPKVVRLSEVAQALASLGYRVHPRPAARSHEQRQREDRALLVRIAVAGAAFGNAMLFAFALYSGTFSDMDAEHIALFRWASFAVATPAIMFSATTFIRGAWGALRTRTPHMDLPVSIGIASGYLWGAVNTVRGSGEVYFDSITAVIFLLLVGRWLQRREQRAAGDAAELLGALAPSTARLVDGETVREVPAAILCTGALVEIRAGDHIPADGVVLEGRSCVDTSLLTGESRPSRVAAGDRVHAGCVNVEAPLRMRVELAGEATRVGRLMKSVAEAAQRRAPTVRLADRIAGWFVLAVLGAALITLGMWLRWDPDHALEHMIALLVVTCPCALGMATPLAVSAALGRAARRGILVKGGDALEKLARPALVVFDKTGTLTEGKLRLVAWEGDASVQPLVAAVEASSAHPVARALCDALGAPDRSAPVSVAQTTGGGIEARHGGRALVVGSPSFVGSRVTVPAWASAAVERHALEGRTPVVVALAGEVVAVAALGDPLRSDARDGLERLRAWGYRLAVLSGDHPLAVAALVKELGVDLVEARGGSSPEDKLAFVERARRSGPVVMVGDGLNDAAALSAATVGIAVHGGAEASLAAADAFTTRAGIAPVLELFVGARRTFTVIRRGIAFSLLYNVVGFTLAVAGLLGPLAAAILMPLSSLTVVTNAYRSRTFPEAST
jgi:Cu2+-exporting ATPase